MANYDVNPQIHRMQDPFTGKMYDFSTLGDERAERLYQALEMALKDECPPDRKDYLCQAGEAEDTTSETCELCIKRWATAQFGKYRD